MEGKAVKQIRNEAVYTATYDRARAEALIAKVVIEGEGDVFDPAKVKSVAYKITMGEEADKPGEQFIQSVTAEVVVDTSPPPDPVA